MKSTKKVAAACNVSTDQNDVTKRQYTAATRKASNSDSPKALFAFAFLHRARRETRQELRSVRSSTIEYQPPHIAEYPAYGQHCWYEAWLEMTAWLALCVALDAYERARQASYMPPWALQQYMTTLMAALDTYNEAWYGLETCLHGTPA